jgi:hypothetical protein
MDRPVGRRVPGGRRSADDLQAAEAGAVGMTCSPESIDANADGSFADFYIRDSKTGVPEIRIAFYLPDGYENNDELTCEDVTLTFNPQTKKTVLPTSSNSELVTLDSRHPQ